MRPGAQVQAAIEILTQFEEAPRPLERILRDWGKANRYAGSKDRRAIGAYAYGVMRDRGRLAHIMGSDEPRKLLIAWLAKQGDEGWQGWFNGERHHPQPLAAEEEERAFGQSADFPLAARLNVPDFLVPSLEETFGAELEPAMAGFNARAPLDIRVNTLKTTPGEVKAALESEGLSFSATPYATNGLRLGADEPTPNLEALEIFRAGHIEVQDEGSQIAAEVSGAAPGMAIVDLCAGGGGKTLALAALMDNEGMLLASDIEDAKLANLKRRLHRAEVTNAEVRTLEPWEGEQDTSLADWKEKADLVLIDAPCSGSGTWRRHPDARWRLTEEELHRMRQLQAEVLDRGARLVKPEGRLLYITCSVLAPENDESVAAFLEAHLDFSVADIPIAAPHLKKQHGLQLAPHITGCDGFYMSLMIKAGV